MEIHATKDMNHFGKSYLGRKSFCIDENGLDVYNCFINTKKGELTRYEIP